MQWLSNHIIPKVGRFLMALCTQLIFTSSGSMGEVKSNAAYVCSCGSLNPGYLPVFRVIHNQCQSGKNLQGSREGCMMVLFTANTTSYSSFNVWGSGGSTIKVLDQKVEGLSPGPAGLPPFVPLGKALNSVYIATPPPIEVRKAVGNQP